jgi:hypothetical protein
MKKLNPDKKKMYEGILYRIAIDLKKFLDEHEFGEFNFSAIIKEGNIVNTYSVSGKTTHGPLKIQEDERAFLFDLLK